MLLRQNHLSISASLGGTNWLPLPQGLFTHCETQKGRKGGHEEKSTKESFLSTVGFFFSFLPTWYFLFGLSSEWLFRLRVTVGSAQNWTSRSWSNASTPDQSDQRILYGQDKHLPFITEVAYYMGLRRLPVKTALWYSQAELRTKKCKAIILLQGKKDFVDYIYFIYFFWYFFFSPPSSQKCGSTKAWISKQQQEICLYF